MSRLERKGKMVSRAACWLATGPWLLLALPAAPYSALVWVCCSTQHLLFLLIFPCENAKMASSLSPRRVPFSLAEGRVLPCQP